MIDGAMLGSTVGVVGGLWETEVCFTETGSGLVDGRRVGRGGPSGSAAAVLPEGPQQWRRQLSSRDKPAVAVTSWKRTEVDRKRSRPCKASSFIYFLRFYGGSHHRTPQPPPKPDSERQLQIDGRSSSGGVRREFMSLVDILMQLGGHTKPTLAARSQAMSIELEQLQPRAPSFRKNHWRRRQSSELNLQDAANSYCVSWQPVIDA